MTDIYTIVNIFLNNSIIPLLFLLVIIAYHFILLIFKDRFLIKIVRSLEDPGSIDVDDFKEHPLVNIIVPAWKEGETFRKCLDSIANLRYPNLKVIVNAGGSDETNNIANFYKNNEKFVILEQTTGGDRAEFGKIRALNDCLPYVTEGVSFFIDADCILTDDLLSRILYPVVYLNEKVIIGGNRPLISQNRIDLVKYIQVNRLSYHKKRNISRYEHKYASGANTLITFDVLQSIGRFDSTKPIAEDAARGDDITSHGFKMYALYEYKSRIQTEYPDKIKAFFVQKRRYIENSLYLAVLKKDKRYYLRYLALTLSALIILLFPLYFLLNLNLFYISLIIFLHLYMIKLRKIFIFRGIVDKEDYEAFSIIFYLKILLYIYLEIVTIAVTLLGLSKFFKRAKEINSGKSD